MSKRAITAVASILAIVSMQVAAQSVYSWKDANGVVHYGDRPMQGNATKQEVTQRSGSGCPDGKCPQAPSYQDRARESAYRSSSAPQRDHALEARQRAAQQKQASEEAAAKQRAALQKRCEDQRRVGCDTDRGLRNMHTDENQARVRVIRTYR